MGAIVKCICGVSIDITGATPRLDGIKGLVSPLWGNDYSSFGQVIRWN